MLNPSWSSLATRRLKQSWRSWTSNTRSTNTWSLICLRRNSGNVHSFSLAGCVLQSSGLMSTPSTIMCCSLILLLLQVEEPDTANHTDTRNSATHAEKEGVYILQLCVWIFVEVLLLISPIILCTGHNGTHGHTLPIGWQCLLQGFSATYWQSVSMAGGKSNSNAHFLLFTVCSFWSVFVASCILLIFLAAEGWVLWQHLSLFC